MGTPYLFFLIPLSPLLALLSYKLVSRFLSRTAILILAGLMIVISIPFVSEYSYSLYPGIIIGSLAFALFNFVALYLIRKNWSNWISWIFAFLLVIPATAMFFGRAFVGEPKIYSNAHFKGYAAIHYRPASPTILEMPQVDFYKTILGGILKKRIGTVYDNDYEKSIITFEDTLFGRLLVFDKEKAKLSAQ